MLEHASDAVYGPYRLLKQTMSSKNTKSNFHLTDERMTNHGSCKESRGLAESKRRSSQLKRAVMASEYSFLGVPRVDFNFPVAVVCAERRKEGYLPQQVYKPVHTM